MSNDDSGCGCNDCGCGDDHASDEEAFHPMGAEWESEMREMLDDTDYDADLGMDMARDAMRLVQGEISEAEFNEQYHEAVVEEFGTDERPTMEAFEEVENSEGGGILDKLAGRVGDGGAVAERLAGFDPDTDQTRRETMKKMGAAGAVLGLGAMASKDTAQNAAAAAEEGAGGFGDEEDGIQWGMVIDLERCDGCLQCVTGCIEENNTSTGANWMYVLTYEDERTETENFLVRPCQHCTNAPCEKVCPVEARHTRDRDGLVLTNYEICIGCRYCQVACPYGVNYFQWGEPDVPYDELSGSSLDHDELKEMSEEERQQVMTDEMDMVHDYRGQWNDSRPPQGVMGKCTFCPSRQDGHEGEDRVATTACMDACDTAGMSAIHFGDMNDSESRPRQYLSQRVEQELNENTTLDNDEEWGETVTNWQKVSAFKLLEDLGTEPNVVYLGNEPSPNTKQVEGPVSYEDIGAVDTRKDFTDQGAAANDKQGIWGDD